MNQFVRIVCGERGGKCGLAIAEVLEVAGETVVTDGRNTYIAGTPWMYFDGCPRHASRPTPGTKRERLCLVPWNEIVESVDEARRTHKAKRVPWTEQQGMLAAKDYASAAWEGEF